MLIEMPLNFDKHRLYFTSGCENTHKKSLRIKTGIKITSDRYPRSLQFCNQQRVPSSLLLAPLATAQRPLSLGPFSIHKYAEIPFPFRPNPRNNTLLSPPASGHDFPRKYACIFPSKNISLLLRAPEFPPPLTLFTLPQFFSI